MTLYLIGSYASDQKHVGGCDSVVGLENAGKLQALVVPA